MGRAGVVNIRRKAREQQQRVCLRELNRGQCWCGGPQVRNVIGKPQGWRTRDEEKSKEGNVAWEGPKGSTVGTKLTEQKAKGPKRPGGGDVLHWAPEGTVDTKPIGMSNQGVSRAEGGGGGCRNPQK